ncbi:MAG: hypothetical protein WD847_09340 [Pirellulales bacterium]
MQRKSRRWLAGRVKKVMAIRSVDCHDLYPETGQRLSRPPGKVVLTVSATPMAMLQPISPQNPKEPAGNKKTGEPFGSPVFF